MIRLKELREAKHWSQRRFGMEFNITQAVVSKYEMGKSEPNIELLIRFADFFNVSVDYLIGHSDKRLSYSKSELTDDETKFLYSYNLLTTEQKTKLMAYMQGLTD